MRYKTTPQIIEDKHLFNDVSPNKVAEKLGISHTYVYRIKNGQVIVSEDQYYRLKNTIKEILSENA